MAVFVVVVVVVVFVGIIPESWAWCEDEAANELQDLYASRTLSRWHQSAWQKVIRIAVWTLSRFRDAPRWSNPVAVVPDLIAWLLDCRQWLSGAVVQWCGFFWLLAVRSQSPAVCQCRVAFIKGATPQSIRQWHWMCMQSKGLDALRELSSRIQFEFAFDA